MAEGTGNKNIVLEERRFFELDFDGEPKKFFLDMPTSEQIRKAEWHYSKVYNKALVEGIATTSEMMAILKERGLYGNDYEKKLQDLQVAVALKIAEMSNETEDEVRKNLALEVRALRDELYQWNQRITGPLSNSCEQMADDAKTEYLTSVVVQDKDGKPIWDNYEDFLNESDQRLAIKSRYEVLLWVQGLDSDFLDKTPENQVLNELAEEARRQAEEEKEMPKLKAAKEDKPDQKGTKDEKAPKKRGRKKAAK
jgi:hypothetical protein